MCSSRPISARRSEETLCLHPTNTRFLWTDEVSCLATQKCGGGSEHRRQLRRRDLHVLAATRWTTCRLPARTLTVAVARGHTENETLTVCSLDTALAEIVRTLHHIVTTQGAAAGADRRAPWPRYIISNTHAPAETAEERIAIGSLVAYSASSAAPPPRPVDCWIDI